MQKDIEWQNFSHFKYALTLPYLYENNFFNELFQKFYAYKFHAYKSICMKYKLCVMMAFILYRWLYFLNTFWMSFSIAENY
jgi:hypothetical protein